MKSLYPQFLLHLEQSQMLPPGARLLVACSGGLDSMVLAHLLLRLRQRMQWTLVLAHINYKQRALASDLDEESVRALARTHAVLCEVDCDFHYDSGNFQDEARNYRYRAFARWVSSHQLDGVCTAHHLDDQIETVMFRLLRGAGIQGLSGMSEIEQLTWDEGVRVLRPLLPFYRRDIEVYAAAEKVSYRTDESNQSLRYTRNRIRNELLPLLYDLAPQFGERLEDLRRFFASLDLFMESESKPLLESCRDGDRVSLSRERFMAFPVIVQKEILYRLFSHYLPQCFISRETIDKLCDLIIRDRGHAHYDLPQGFYFEKDAERIYVCRK